MHRYFKVRAKESFIYKESGQHLPVEAGKIYEAKDIEVLVNKSNRTRLGVMIDGNKFFDLDNHLQKFEEIKD